MNLENLRDCVIRPTLKHLGLYSPAAENLVLGTALVESKAEYLRQIKGPALGLWQIEPATWQDLHENFLRFRTDLRARLDELSTTAKMTEGPLEMVGNLYYGCAVCRLIYRRAPEPLPDADDAEGMASYWKRFYNSSLGSGTVQRALAHFIVACA